MGLHARRPRPHRDTWTASGQVSRAVVETTPACGSRRGARGEGAVGSAQGPVTRRPALSRRRVAVTGPRVRLCRDYLSLSPRSSVSVWPLRGLGVSDAPRPPQHPVLLSGAHTEGEPRPLHTHTECVLLGGGTPRLLGSRSPEPAGSPAVTPDVTAGAPAQGRPQCGAHRDRDPRELRASPTVPACGQAGGGALAALPPPRGWGVGAGLGWQAAGSSQAQGPAAGL